MAKKKYTKASLKKAVEAYFRSIRAVGFARDGNGRRIIVEDGSYIKVEQYIKPPSVTGLCLYLGIDKKTFYNYAEGEDWRELHEVCAWAKLVIQDYLETELNTRKKGIQGIIFNLKNNYGWRERTETDLTERAAKAVAMSGGGMSAEDMIREMLGEQTDEEQGNDAE